MFNLRDNHACEVICCSKIPSGPQRRHLKPPSLGQVEGTRLKAKCPVATWDKLMSLPSKKSGRSFCLVNEITAPIPSKKSRPNSKPRLGTFTTLTQTANKLFPTITGNLYLTLLL
jgi:hypothetical protein